MRKLPRPALSLLHLVFAVSVLACEGDSDSEDTDGVLEHAPPQCEGEDAERVELILSLEPDLANGEDFFFNRACGTNACHGPDGEIGPGAELPIKIPLYADAEIACLLLKGKNEMPTQAAFPDQDLRDGIAYVRATFDP